MGALVNLLPILIMGAFLYFMMIRPQQKAANKKQEMLGALTRGDHVVTIGGLHGVVDEVRQADNIIVLDCEGVYLTFELMAIARLIDSAEAEEVTEETYVEEVEVEEEPLEEVEVEVEEPAEDVEVTEIIIDEPSEDKE